MIYNNIKLIAKNIVRDIIEEGNTLYEGFHNKKSLNSFSRNLRNHLYKMSGKEFAISFEPIENGFLYYVRLKK